MHDDGNSYCFKIFNYNHINWFYIVYGWEQPESVFEDVDRKTEILFYEFRA